MTDDEFGTRFYQLGVAAGRIQVAGEISQWVANHPALLISLESVSLAKDLISLCHTIIQQAGRSQPSKELHAHEPAHVA